MAVYGALINAGTIVIYDGAPDFPEPDRMWEFCAKHKVEILGISPTLVRALVAKGDDLPKAHDLSHLRAFASTGEPWNPAPSWWLFERVGESKLPIMFQSALVTILCAASLFAQTTSTEVLGTVTDATGAIVPAAEVTLLRVATGEKRQTKSDASGNYSFPLIEIGDYTVTVGVVTGVAVIKMKGTQWLRRANLSVDVTGGVTGVDFSLLNGDIDGNNVIDSDDFDRLVQGFGQIPGDPGYDPATDLNGDTATDSDDFDILVRNFGLGGD